MRLLSFQNGRSWLPVDSSVFAAAVMLVGGLLLGSGCHGKRTADDTARTSQALSVPAWVAGHSYQIGNRVTYTGVVYEARQSHTSQAQFPPAGNPSLWFRPTPTGISAWAYQTKYIVGSDVTYQGLVYECLQLHWVDDPAWTPKVSTALWRCASPSCGGSCQGKTAGSLCDDGDPCTTDVCNGSGKCVVSSTTCTSAPALARALLVASTMPLTPADEMLRARVHDLGYEVDVKIASAAVSPDANGHDVVIVSDSVTPTAVSTKFRDVATPVVVLEFGIWKDMRMAGGTGTTGDTGFTTGDQDSIDIVLGAHQLAAGRSGTVRTAAAISSFNWAKTLGGGAIKVATIAGDATKASIFAYDLGGNMVGGTAPGRRVGMFMSELVPGVLTTTGWDLFDAAVRWAAEKPALLVVGNTTLPAADIALRDRLTSLGMPVAVAVDSAPASSATGKQVVVVSESADSTALGSTYTAVTVPVVSLEPKIFGTLGMTGTTWGTSMGSTSSVQNLTITNKDHPLAAGLSGTVQVTSAPKTLFWGKPGPNAINVAALTAAAPGQYSIFAYEKGSGMVQGTAPARRVAWFAKADVPPVLTSDGWKLFDAAVIWAAGRTDKERLACGGKGEGAVCDTGIENCENGLCRSGQCVLPPDAQPGCFIDPSLTCVIPRGDNTFTAVFGYRVRKSENVYLPVSANNFVSPSPSDRGQPGWFQGATSDRPSQPVAFAGDFLGGQTLSWALGTHLVNATADLVGTRSCAFTEDGQDGPSVVMGGEEIPISYDRGKIATSSSVDTEQTGGLAVGSLQGTFDVTDTGETTYRLPLDVPMGRRDIQPRLSLSYNSQRGNGLLGVGWALSGLSQIAICPTNLRMEAHRPMKFDGTDPLCLDGERLIEVTDFSPGNAYGKAAPGDKEYRTQRSEGSRIVARGVTNGVPAFFEVMTREGRILTFGVHPTYPAGAHDPHKVLGRRRYDRASKVVTAEWPLTKSADRFGNWMEVLYKVDQEDSEDILGGFYETERRPDRIRYTGFTPPGSASGARPPLRSVVFKYSPDDGALCSSPTGSVPCKRSPLDRVNHWFAGVNMVITKLLVGVEMYAPRSLSQ